MQVMILIKATTESEAGVMPSMELIQAMGRYNQELMDAGIHLAGEGLKPTSVGKRMTFDGDNRTVTDGPFGNTEELVAGFWLWQVKDMDEAVEWLKRCPNPMPGPSVVEIRPVYEEADFAEWMTAAMREQQDETGEETQDG